MGVCVVWVCVGVGVCSVRGALIWIRRIQEFLQRDRGIHCTMYCVVNLVILATKVNSSCISFTTN